MSKVLWRSAGLMGAAIWIAMVAFWIQDAFARGRQPTLVYIAPSPGKIHGKRVHKFKSHARCIDTKTKRWIKGCR